jgi:HNH endonuclease
MAERTCSIDGCDRKHSGQGLCSAHYQRWRLHGTTDLLTLPPEERFWAKLRETADGCWEFTEGTANGYGLYHVATKKVYAHRFAYTALIGEIPAGLDLDHLCRNRLCANPWHLEPVTRGVNVLRGQTLAAANLLKTHCPQGHPYTPENLVRSEKKGRKCRTCVNARRRIYTATH